MKSFYDRSFAFSGAITNSLAIHMLLKKFHFLYGSGVIENKIFHSLRSLFIIWLWISFLRKKEALNRFFETEVNSAKNSIDFEKILTKTDFSPAYESLKESVMQSSFGGMLSMFGGEAALEPLRDHLHKNFKKSIISITSSEAFQNVLNEAIKSPDFSNDVYMKIKFDCKHKTRRINIKMVKDIIQEMIEEHLGWLVIWVQF